MAKRNYHTHCTPQYLFLMNTETNTSKCRSRNMCNSKIKVDKLNKDIIIFEEEAVESWINKIDSKEYSNELSVVYMFCATPGGSSLDPELNSEAFFCNWSVVGWRSGRRRCKCKHLQAQVDHTRPHGTCSNTSYTIHGGHPCYMYTSLLC